MLPNKAAVIVAAAWAAGIAPDEISTVSEWAAEHRIVAAETSANPGPWDNNFLPYLTEIMDCLMPAHPCESVTFMKSAQSGGTEVGTNWLGFIMDKVPGPTLVVHPTVDAGKGWVAEKLDPTIEETPAMKHKIAAQRSRSSKGSTTLFKRFRGGSIRVTGANSTAALRQKSIRYMIKDDWSDWPLDLDGQGDPDAMADARLIAYTAAGLNKTLQISTPTTLGSCRTKAGYEASDQRRYFIECPQCGLSQVLRFFPKKREPFAGGLRFNKEFPHNAEYICESGDGCIIEHYEKAAIIQPENGARWVATKPGPGRQPGFHINALYSRVTTWDKMVARFMATKDIPRKFKTFYNLWLGEAWEEKGDAPEWEILATRRETYKLGRIMPGGLVLTCFIDVQKDGLYYEGVAWGAGMTSWVIEAGFIQGDTADINSKCWQDLTELFERKYPDAYGNSWGWDAFGVDSGYNTNQVYSWVRKHMPKAIATKGVPGWTEPALGAPRRIDVRASGEKRRAGVRVWAIGTWSLKSELYANLRKSPPIDGDEEFKAGYLHFPADLPEEYFKQLTAEYLKQETNKHGITQTRWVVSGENHFHDCRIGNRALTDHPNLLLSRFTEDNWIALAVKRAVAPEKDQPDMDKLWNPPVKPDDKSSETKGDAPAKRRTVPRRRASSFVKGE
jgi:phage terminase large subunit GpA-like protein